MIFFRGSSSQEVLYNSTNSVSENSTSIVYLIIIFILPCAVIASKVRKKDQMEPSVIIKPSNVEALIKENKILREIELKIHSDLRAIMIFMADTAEMIKVLNIQSEESFFYCAVENLDYYAKPLEIRGKQFLNHQLDHDIKKLCTIELEIDEEKLIQFNIHWQMCYRRYLSILRMMINELIDYQKEVLMDEEISTLIRNNYQSDNFSVEEIMTEILFPFSIVEQRLEKHWKLVRDAFTENYNNLWNLITLIPYIKKKKKNFIKIKEIKIKKSNNKVLELLNKMLSNKNIKEKTLMEYLRTILRNTVTSHTKYSKKRRKGT